MFHRMKKDYANWVLGIGGFLLLLELFVFNPGLIFSLLVSIGMMYFAKQGAKGKFGKFLFWIGVIILLVSVLNMFTVKFFLFSIVVYYFIQLIQKKNTSDVIKPIIKNKEALIHQEEPTIKREALFKNTFFNRSITPDHVYEWDDVNIQVGIADTVIDLSYTVLPKGETVVFIRNIVGNVKILVPYDMEVNINHSVLFGSFTIFGEKEVNVFNQNVNIKTAVFDQADTRVKIFTSFVAGSLEVKRI